MTPQIHQTHNFATYLNINEILILLTDWIVETITWNSIEGKMMLLNGNKNISSYIQCPFLSFLIFKYTRSHRMNQFFCIKLRERNLSRNSLFNRE